MRKITEEDLFEQEFHKMGLPALESMGVHAFRKTLPDRTVIVIQLFPSTARMIGAVFLSDAELDEYIDSFLQETPKFLEGRLK